MPNLPFDCMSQVITQIDRRHDLFTLLTVSRGVFQIAVRRLYHDPLHRDWPRGYDPRLGKLVRLLLSLSPANDNKTNCLRQAVGLIDATTPTSTTTMLNYLSFLRVVHWSDQLHKDDFSNDMTGTWPSEVFLSTLTWAFVGHRLEEVVELDVFEIHIMDDGNVQQDGQDEAGGGDGGEEEEAGNPAPSHVVRHPRGDGRYLQHVSRMTNLRKIWVCRTDWRDYEWDPFYSRVEKIVLAMQREHGLQHLQECRLTPNPLVSGPYLGDGGIMDRIYISGAQHIYSLVSTATGGLARNQYPTNTPLVVPRPDGSFITLDRLFDPDVARLYWLSGPGDGSRRMDPAVVVQLYPDLSDIQILQRCRGMTTLHMYPTASSNDGLAWAAYEAEYRQLALSGGARPLLQAATTASTSTSATPANNNAVVAPLIPLEGLFVQFASDEPTINLKPLWDGLQGFSQTLEWLRAKLPPPSLPSSEQQQQEPLVLSTSLPLPRLKILELDRIEIDPSIWKMAPLMEDVTICLLPTGAAAAASNSLGDPQKTTTSTITTRALDLPDLAAAADVVLHCPLLQKLHLRYSAVHLFDPDSFKISGRHLKHLSLSVVCANYRKDHNGRFDRNHKTYCHHCCVTAAAAGSEEDDGDDNGDLLYYVRHPDRWTWDWPLPQLTYLELRGDLLAMRFDIVSLLRSCPSLQTMDLEHASERRQQDYYFPLCVKNQVLSIAAAAAGATSATEADAAEGADAHASSYVSVPSVQNLNLSGSWSIQAAELACLLGVLLPGLRDLRLHAGGMQFCEDDNDVVDCRGLVHLTRDHPALRYCEIDILPGIEQILQRQQQGGGGIGVATTAQEQLQQEQQQQAEQVKKWLADQLEPMGLTVLDPRQWHIRGDGAGVHATREIVYRFGGYINPSYQLKKGE